MRRFAILFSAGLFSSVFTGLYAQTPAEELDYLKQNIRLWVVHKPNDDSISFYTVKTEGVYLDTDGIIMGKKSNNGMTLCARLLSALFKNPEKKYNGGDLELQHTVYGLLRMLNKPLDICFVNDAAAPMGRKFKVKTSIYTYEVSETELQVWPACYKYMGVDTTVGAIIVGEAFSGSLRDMKAYLVMVLAKLCLGNYSYTPFLPLFTLPNKNAPEKMYKTDPLVCHLMCSDFRNMTADGIAFAFLHLSETSTHPYTTVYLDDWMARTPYIFVGDDHEATETSRNIPGAYFMKNLIRKDFTNMKDTGRHLTNPPFTFDPGQLDKWKIYPLGALTPYRLIRLDIILGFLCYEYCLRFGQDRFIDCLLLNDRRLLKAKPEDQFTVLIENLCNGTKSAGKSALGKVFRPDSNEDLFPLALMDLMTWFPHQAPLGAEFSVPKADFNGLLPGNSFPASVMERYYRIRTKLLDAVVNTSSEAGPFLFRGYTKFRLMVDAMWKVLEDK